MLPQNPETLFIGNALINLEEVDSTNSFALGLLRDSSVVEGTVITAVCQTNGRGQWGNQWRSEAGKNITCSIVLRPTFLSVPLQFDLTRAIALAVNDLISGLLPQIPVHVKWPNDIMAGNKKIAGILIENIITGATVSAAVVGIGLNVNQQEFGDAAPKAVSLYQLLGKEVSKEALLKHLFASLEVRYLQLRAGKTDLLRAEYEQCLFRKNVPARYTDFKQVFEATIQTVSPEGRLVLLDSDGNERSYAMKEIGML
jgi:BirA family transcriptional regulator, biotin operon repressor / biotin---[acetyl-CoA-carboxylase] ligase